MLKRILIYVFLVFISHSLIAQLDTIQMSGMYYNTNLYVYNPSVGGDFSIEKLIINKDTITQELETNGIELDFSSYELKEGSPLNIQIVFKGAYSPVIVNPEALMPPVRFRISKPRYTKSGELQWALRGVPGDFPIIVEQYKWKSWRQVAEIDPVDTVANSIYVLPIDPHSGKNIFRVKSISVKGEEVKSKDCIISPKGISKVIIQNKKIKEEIVLSAKSEYEIYAKDGSLILNGTDRYIDISKLDKGYYTIFFDNQIQEFKKK